MSDPPRPARRRRLAGSALAGVGCAALGWLHHDATDFPRGEPVRVVDRALVERLRGEPGLHLPLDPGYRLAVELDLEDDALNRQVYGTRVDLRERRERQAIHIQLKGERGAIHTDDHNPKAGLLGWLAHATLDVPATPWIAATLVGLWLVGWPRRWGSALGTRDLGRSPDRLTPSVAVDSKGKRKGGRT